MRSAVLMLLGCAGLAFSSDVHTIVFREPGRFGGWPANHGIWSWGNEIVVGFSDARFQSKGADRHQYDNTRPEEPRLARSLDGGESWAIESPRSLLPPEQGGSAVLDLKEPIDFSHPDFAMTLRFTDTNQGESRFWYSLDRGKNWRGPFRFPLLGQTGIAARTDYIVNGRRDAMVFVTAAKKNGKEGRVLCARTLDGGLSWTFIGFIGEEPQGFSIMPSSVRLSPETIMTATRVKQNLDVNWIDIYVSHDNGVHWTLQSPKAADTGGGSGNPPSLLRLDDGRLCLTYGYRSPPFAIYAKLSGDGGKTWTAPRELRSGAAAWDLGYVRSAERPDGKIVSVYYFNDKPHTERFIEATIWDPRQ
jgi:hypothetical protein